ncbi:MAG: SurA N-terminal domain-containing protein [Candidatus Levybacteria bacterium]|nr:SurA N-terminal domain-containing protein [Candidatus Levybacteria bacterium]
MATIKKATAVAKRKSPAPKVSSESIAETTAPMAVKVSKKYLLIGGVVVLLAVALYTFRSFFIVATVNGQPISRLSLIQELEKQGGKQTLTTIVTKTLIEQEAAKKNIVVSQKDIDTELKQIEANLAKQGQTLDQVLQLQGMTRDALTAQIKTQKLVEKLVGPVTVTDKEISDYIAANEATIPQTENMNEVKKTVKTQLQQQKVNEKAQALLQKLQKDAKINYLVSY